MAFEEKIQVLSIHGEMLNATFPAGQALPLSSPSDTHGTITFRYISDGQRFNRHVPLAELGDYQVGQTLTLTIG
jgi:hypothetical protein